MSNIKSTLKMSGNIINGADMLFKNNRTNLNTLKDAMDEVRNVLVKYGIEELEGGTITFTDGELNISNYNIIIEENTSGNEDKKMNDKLNLMLRSDCLEELSEMINDSIMKGIKDNKSLLEVDIREIYNGNDIDNEYEAKLNFIRDVNGE